MLRGDGALFPEGRCWHREPSCSWWLFVMCLTLLEWSCVHGFHTFPGITVGNPTYAHLLPLKVSSLMPRAQIAAVLNVHENKPGQGSSSLSAGRGAWEGRQGAPEHSWLQG